MIISFNETTSVELGLRLISYKIDKPKRRSIKVKVPGRHGALDLSNWMSSEPIFENRSLRFVFDLNMLNYEEAMEFLNKLHGTTVEIAISATSDYKFIGEISISEEMINNYFKEITISCECGPFRYKNELTEVTHSVTSSKTINLYNEQMQTVPTITTSTSMSIQLDGKSFTLESGTTTNKEIVLKAGVNEIEIVGTGTITFSYQEGKI